MRPCRTVGRGGHFQHGDAIDCHREFAVAAIQRDASGGATTPAVGRLRLRQHPRLAALEGEDSAVFSIQLEDVAAALVSDVEQQPGACRRWIPCLKLRLEVQCFAEGALRGFDLDVRWAGKR